MKRLGGKNEGSKQGKHSERPKEWATQHVQHRSGVLAILLWVWRATTNLGWMPCQMQRGPWIWKTNACRIAAWQLAMWVTHLPRLKSSTCFLPFTIIYVFLPLLPSSPNQLREGCASIAWRMLIKPSSSWKSNECTWKTWDLMILWMGITGWRLALFGLLSWDSRWGYVHTYTHVQDFHTCFVHLFYCAF